MKITARTCAPEDKTEPEFEFYLEQGEQSYGVVHLKVRNKSSNPSTSWFVISITKDGYIKRHVAIPRSFGLPVDDLGRVKEI